VLRHISEQSRESMESVLKKKKKLLWEGFAEQEDFKPGMNKYRVIDNEIEIGVSMERIEEAP